MNTTAQKPSIAVATFVPGIGEMRSADFVAMAKICDHIYGKLCLFNLDVPTALWIGHTSTGACHGGTIRDCLMSFHVADSARAIEVIKEALAESGIEQAHYEIALSPRHAALYESVWLPPGRTSVLHGITHEKLLTETKRRHKGMEAAMERENPAFYGLHQQSQQLAALKVELREETWDSLVGCDLALRRVLSIWPVNPPDNFLIRYFPWPINFYRNKAFRSARKLALKWLPSLGKSDDVISKQMHAAFDLFAASKPASTSERRAALHNLQQALARIIEDGRWPESSLLK